MNNEVAKVYGLGCSPIRCRKDTRSQLVAAILMLVLTCTQAWAQVDQQADVSIAIAEQPSVRGNEPGQVGFITFNISNLGPDLAAVRIRASFGLERAIPIVLFGETDGIFPIPDVEPTCSVAQAIGNPTPVITYSLRPRFDNPIAGSEGTICRVRYEISEEAQFGQFDVPVEVDISNQTPGVTDPDLSNNTLTVTWLISDGPGAHAVDATSYPYLIVLLLSIVVLSTYVMRRKKR